MAPNINTILKGKHHSTRFIELDILRGCAIISMIFLHVLWDLDYFNLVSLNQGIYQYNKLVPMLFFILMGICLAITFARKQTTSKGTMVAHLVRRGLWIFNLGMVITVVTVIFMPDRPIFFGVLHCIGLSIILSIPFLKFKSLNVVFASMVLFAGFILGFYYVENPTIGQLIIGLHQGDIARYTIDYFPLLPWFGVSLLGIALGNWLYPNGIRRFSLPDLSQYKPMSLFSWLGKHSLLVYLLHQPIIAGVLALVVLR
jgi:uncharacterized membrane protein